MANTLTVNARVRMLSGDFNWENDVIKVILTSSQYNYQASHETLSDISPAGRVTQPVALQNKTITADGAADADDVTIPSVSGNTITRIFLFTDTGVADTSKLIAMIDTATGLPLTPNGGDVIIVWDNGINKIFRP